MRASIPMKWMTSICSWEKSPSLPRLLLATIGACILLPGRLSGEGTVIFANNILTAPPDRLVRWAEGTPLTGTNFAAQLYYGANAQSLSPVTNPPATFRQPTTTLPGTWVGSRRTLEGFNAGETVTLQVRIWDSNFAATYEDAQASGSLAVASTSFEYILPFLPPAPGSDHMVNFAGITVPSCPAVRPEITLQPQDQSVKLGSNVSFKVVANYPCTYQWQFNESDLAAGTMPTLTIDNARASNAGPYRVVVSSPGGAVTSQVAMLTVEVPVVRLESFAYAENEIHFLVSGITNEACVVESATNLDTTVWTPIYTNVAPFWFTNSAIAADRQRFYRGVFH